MRAYLTVHKIDRVFTQQIYDAFDSGADRLRGDKEQAFGGMT